MSKRGRKHSWWGWNWFSKTVEVNGSGNTIFHCKVQVSEGEGGEPVLCCDSIAYANTPTPFKNHLSGKYRVWYASQKAAKETTVKVKKQPRIDQAFTQEAERKVVEETSLREANLVEIAEMEELLSFVVDDLRPAKSVQGD